MAPKRTAPKKGRAAAAGSKLKPQRKPMAKAKKAVAGPKAKGKAAAGKAKAAAKGSKPANKSKAGPRGRAVANKTGKKGGLKAALKSAGDKMKEKVMSKSALLEKKMKEGSKHVQEKLMAKGNELRKKMKEKLEEAGDDLKHKRKDMRDKLRSKKQQFKEKMRTKKQHLKEHMKHTAQDMEHTGVEVATSLADRLEQWRKKFEDMGWARGKMVNDWATITLLGLNAMGIVLALPVVGVTVYLASSLKHICMAYLLKPALVVGFYFSLALLVNAVAGFFGAWLNRLFLVKFQFFFTAFLVMMLLSFTAFGFVVTSKGGGTPVEGASFRAYSLSGYAGWMRSRILRWEKVKPCFAKANFCNNMPYQTAAEFFSAPISRIQAGCCIPPPVCGHVFEGGRWRFPTNRDADIDCRNWKWQELCVNCNACKAAFLQEVKSRWKKACIVNATIAGGLMVILYRTWYVMRAAGCWDRISAVVAASLAAACSTLKWAVTCKPKEKPAARDDEVLVPSWLEGTDGMEEMEMEPSGTEHKTTEEPEPQEAAQVEGHQQQEEQLPVHEDDDSWASPRQQSGPAFEHFPQGYLAQNPLAQQAMSPWLAENVGDGKYYMQQGYQDPYAYQPDPYAYAAEAYPNQDQSYYADQQYYMTDASQQQAVNYLVPSQGYMDPSQAYVDPQLFYQEGYMDPSQQQQFYMQDPNQAYYPPY